MIPDVWVNIYGDVCGPKSLDYGFLDILRKEINKWDTGYAVLTILLVSILLLNGKDHS